MLDLRVLKNRSDFVAVTRARKSAGTASLVLQVLPWDTVAETHPTATDKPKARIGFTASKKVGNAVARNRAKRRLRSLARDVLSHRAEPDRDYVLIARAGTVTRSYSLLCRDLEAALKKLRALRDPATSG